MLKTDYLPLDNPAWNSLSEADQQFAISYKNIKFYDPDCCAFGGFEDPRFIAEQIRQYAAIVPEFFILGDKPFLPEGLAIKNELICLQMVLNEPIQIETKENMLLLNADHAEEIYQLVNLVQPGYFKSKTHLLGNYYGIFKDNQLVALTGERMKTNTFTELSAVITHPDHTGKGYAKQLVARAANQIFNSGKLPYLHVAETNISAIGLYEKLGFRTRRKMSFWHLVK